MNTDRAWEKYGKDNPYFGVLADQRYRGKVLDQTARKAFFVSGVEHIERVLSVIDRRLEARLSLEKALDFGCGVGRLAIPLAQRFSSTVGVDISQSMLREASVNAQQMGINNLRLVEQLSDLASEHGSFSFVNSFIVLQHVNPQRGLHFVGEMIDLLAAGGCGAIHMTYARTRYASNLGARTLASRAMQAVRRPLAALRRRLAASDPEMQMNDYPLNKVLFQLQTRRVKDFFAEFSDHGGHLGLTLYLRKP